MRLHSDSSGSRCCTVKAGLSHIDFEARTPSNNLAVFATHVGCVGSDRRVLDSLRKQRNSTDYDGDLVTEISLDECLTQAKALLAEAEHKLG